MPPLLRLLAALIAAAACGGPQDRVVQELGPGPRLPPPSEFAFGCTLVPSRDGAQAPAPVLALCRAGEAQMIRVDRVPGGMRVGIRFTDAQRRALELFVYRSDGDFERGARAVARIRRGEPRVFEPESGWISVQHYDRGDRAIAIQFSLRFPGVVVHGSLREGDVPLPPPPPPPPRPDPWNLERDAGPAAPPM